MERASKCHLCSEDFISRFELHNHMTREHRKTGCTLNISFICNICDHVFGCKEHLIRHMRTHTGERPFKCTVDDCQMAFKQQSALKDHIKGKHSDKRTYKCRFSGCRYATKTSSALSAHKRVHSDDRRFTCSDCDYKTISNMNLKRHRSHRHSARRDFKCKHPQCTKTFKSSADLKSHCSNRHEAKNASCDHPGCNKKYANASALRKHKRSVHSTKGLVCQTLNCSYRTNNSCHLIRHMILHNEGNEKIPCHLEDCQHKGRNKQALEHHMRLHKTHLLCPESGCGHFSTTKAALEDHVKFHNPLGRPFQCPLCFKHFITMPRLQDHCVVHTNEKPLACGHCEFAASARSTVQRHISSKHPNVEFPYIVHLLDDRECLVCEVTLSTAEFFLHCEGHLDPNLMEA